MHETPRIFAITIWSIFVIGVSIILFFNIRPYYAVKVGQVYGSEDVFDDRERDSVIAVSDGYVKFIDIQGKSQSTTVNCFYGHRKLRVGVKK